MESDLIDRMTQAIQEQFPQLDPSGLEIVGRVLVLAQHLDRGVNQALEIHQLSLGQYDILATLRRQGPEGKLTPKQLMQSVALSSGGMTSRLDRLEQAGWIRREADPDDRRGVVVALTQCGREMIDEATNTRLQQANEALPDFSAEEKAQFITLLRRWLLQIAAGKED